MSTRLEGPRSTQFLFSTGRVAELRCVPSFRAMHREGLLDAHGARILEAVLEGEMETLEGSIEDAILRHIFIDPPLDGVGLGVLDDVEVQEAVTFAINAYLAARRPVLEDDDEAAEEAAAAPVASEPDLEPDVLTAPDPDTQALLDQAEAVILAQEPPAEPESGEAE